MTTTSQKSTKQSIDVSIEILHKEQYMTVFKVKAREGRFIVMDYKDRLSKTPDTEIFWESGAIQVLPHSSEYKTIDKLVGEFVKRQSK